MPPLPPGAITFLFTDIEGSTRLWEQYPELMATALARHDALLRGAITEHYGHIFKTMGDAFCAAFTSPADAIRAAVAAQRALGQELPSLRVRTAVHTGEADLRDGDYFGPALNRVARLLDAGHGGQVLLSRAAVEAVAEGLPSQSELRPLGTHRLRDIAAAEAIYQLVAPGLQTRFPPLETLDVAFRRGVMRAGAIAGVVLAVVSGLAATAVWQSRRAERERARAEMHAGISRRERYAAQMNLAGQDLETGDLDHALELVNRQQPASGEKDLRGFAWRYLRRACQGDARFTFAEHTNTVNAISISPDGRLLASGSRDRRVLLWDLVSRRRVAALPQGDAITAVVFSPDGRILAIGTSGAKSGAVNLLNVATRRVIAVLKGGPLSNGALAFSPDGKTLAAGSGPEIHLWDLGARHVIATLPGDTAEAEAKALAFSPDSRMLAYAFECNPITVKLWDVTTKREAAALGGHHGFVFSLAFSPDGKTLATGSGDSTVRLWDVGTQRTMHVLRGLASGVSAVVFSRDGKLLATGSGDGLVRLWEVVSGQPVQLLKGHLGSVSSVAFTPDSRMVASGSDDHTVRLWSTRRPPESDLLRGHRAWVWHVAFSPDSKTLASAGGFDGTVKLWDVATGREIRSRSIAARPGEKGGVACVAFSPDGRYLAISGTPSPIQLWDAGLRRQIGRLPIDARGSPYVVFSPDGKFLASCSGDRTVRLWKVASQREVRHLPGHLEVNMNTTLAFSADARRLAVTDTTRALLWDLRSAPATPVFQGYPVGGGLAFAPDGRTLVAGGGDGRLWCWDVATGQLTTTPAGHAGGVPEVAFSPDGRDVATVGFDGTVRLWDPQIRQEILTLKGHQGPLHGMAFAPDGNTLATGGADGTVRLWRAVPFAKETGSAASRSTAP